MSTLPYPFVSINTPRTNMRVCFSVSSASQSKIVNCTVVVVFFNPRGRLVSTPDYAGACAGLWRPPAKCSALF